MPVALIVVFFVIYVVINKIGFLSFMGWFVCGVGFIALLFKLQGDWEKSVEKNDKTGAVSRGITGHHMVTHGKPQAELICPHCQTKGHVLTKKVSKKAGISGAKATGAVLTGGVSLLATGLSRKDKLTEAHCVNCDSTWHF